AFYDRGTTASTPGCSEPVGRIVLPTLLGKSPTVMASATLTEQRLESLRGAKRPTWRCIGRVSAVEVRCARRSHRSAQRCLHGRGHFPCSRNAVSLDLYS